MLQGLGLGTACVAFDAFGLEPRWLQVDRHRVAVDGLPRALEGFRIAQVTDAHLQGLGRVEASIIAAVERAEPQLIVLTGDLVDHLERLDDLAELCSQLGQRGARVLATLGNWEHWGRVPRADLARTYERGGAALLVDEWHAQDGLGVYASDDLTGGNPRAIAASPGAPVELLLTHSPAFVDQYAAPRPFALALAGHTHGGQIRAGSYAPFVPPGSGRFVAGWYESELGPLYVSRGTGTSIVAARFCCRPELPVFELVRA